MYKLTTLFVAALFATTTSVFSEGMDKGLDIPGNVKDLFSFLQKGEYKSFKVHENGTHLSAGPHADYDMPVQVYYSNKMSESLAAGDEEHPLGAGVVKELFENDAKTLLGWSVYVKTQKDSDDGNGYFWVEFLSTTNPNKVPAPAENGSSACVGCHSGGVDYVLSSFPPES